MKSFSRYQTLRNCSFVTQFTSVLGMSKNATEAKYILFVFFKVIRKYIPPFNFRAFLAFLPSDFESFFTKDNSNRFLKKFDYDEFINALFLEKKVKHYNLFCSTNEVEAAVSAVFEVIKQQITENQYKDFMSNIPLDLRKILLKDYVFDGHNYIV